MDSNISPDKDDINNHCCSCQHTYSTKIGYRTHLQNVHKVAMVESSQIKRKINPNITPDVEDPFYCRSCKSIYKSGYRSHLKYIHKMKLTPLRSVPKYDPDMKENGSKEMSCITCKLVFPRRLGYRMHMRKHSVTGYKPLFRPGRPSRVNPNIVTDSDDPNNYCKSCDITLKNRTGYKSHIRVLHNVVKYALSTPNPAIIPNTSDPTNQHCASCYHTYSSRNAYLRHLRIVHSMNTGLEGRKKKFDPKVKPDINDPNHYCCSCKRMYSRRAYTGHLKKLHGVKFINDWKSNVNPTTEPDIEDPNNYCKSCNRNCRHKYNYRKQLRKLYNIHL